MTTANKVTILRILFIPFFVVEVLYYANSGNEVHLGLAILSALATARTTSLLHASHDTLAQAATPDREEVIVARLDLERLRAFRRENLLEFNPEIQGKLLPVAYEAFRRRRAADGKRRVI